jgi:HEAT repeat protein
LTLGFTALSSPAPARPPAEAPRAQQTQAPRPRFQAGQGRAYEASVTSDSAIHLRDGRAQRILLQTRGKLSIRVIARSPEQTSLLLAFDSPVVQAGDGVQQAPASVLDELAGSLARPFLVRLDALGKIEQLRFRQGTSTVARGLLKATAASLQLVAPATLTPAWVVEEQDSTGAFLARYLRDASGVERTWENYTRLASGQGLVPAESAGAKEARGRVHQSLDDDGWPRALTSASSLRLEPGNGLPASDSKLAIQLHLERSLDGEALADFPLEESDLLSSLDRVEAAPSAPQGGSPRPSFAALAASVGSPREDGKQRARGMVAMRELFREDPTAVEEARKAILGGAPAAVAKPTLGALGASGSPRSQKALAEIAASRVDLDLRTDALVHLGLTPAPTLDSVTAAEQLSRSAEPEVRDTARLALGNQARSLLAEGRDEEALEPLRHLFDAYEAAASPEEKALLLRAMGNSGARSVLPLARNAALSPWPALRSAAASAVRLIEDPQADALLDALLLRDGDPEVRGGAAAALDSRPLETHIPALTQALGADTSSVVRRRVIDLLHRSLPSPEAAALLALAAERDPDPELRALAASLR